MQTSPIRIIGLMCGTSHDGLDLADVVFHLPVGWSASSHDPRLLASGLRYELAGTQFSPLPESLQKRLRGVMEDSALAYAELDRDVALFFAEQVRTYCRKSGIKPDYLASHGVTVFHDPAKGLTTQIAHGGVLSAATGIACISDFRIQDVARGGQGAPLVPVADAWLFSTYDATLNLGGFANVSLIGSGSVMGYDTSPCNIVLNTVAAQMHLAYDEGGKIAREGNVVSGLLERLNALPYYHAAPPKSLGYEWVREHVLPLVMDQKYRWPDVMATFTEHIAVQCGRALTDMEGKVLVTGGGARNTYLVERIQAHVNATVRVGSDELIDFREALAFALLGLLRVLHLPNAYASVTGADTNGCNGALYIP